MARTLLGDDSRVILATSPQKAGRQGADRSRAPGGAGRGRTRRAVTAWTDTDVDARADGAQAGSRRTVASRATIDDLGVTIVPFVERRRSVAEADRLQERSGAVRDGRRRAAASLAPPADFPEASLATALRQRCRRRRPEGARPAEAPGRQARVGARRSSRLSTHGIRRQRRAGAARNRAAAPLPEFTAPGDDAEAFALLKRQLDAAVANRGQSPGEVFGEKLTQVNTSNHYTSQPLTPERVDALEPREDDRVLPRALRQRRRLHVLHGRRVQGRRGAAAAGAVRRIAAVDRQGVRRASRTSALQLPGRRSQQAKVEKGREPRGQTVISFFADPLDRSDGAGADHRRDRRCSTSRCATSCARSSGRPTRCRVGLAQPLPQRGAGHIEVQLRRGAGEHRRR